MGKPVGDRLPSPPPGSLLAADDLYRAIAGHLVGESPLVVWARELGDLHAALIPARLGRAPRRNVGAGEPAWTDIRRTVAAIDVWSARHMPLARGARMHTHSLGDVISHNAEVYAAAWWTVLHSEDAEVRHAAWVRLGEAREGYVEMVNETQQNRLRFPSGTV